MSAPSPLTLERYGCSLEIKGVDAEARTIEGYAAVFGNVDKGGDVIEQKAFEKTLTERQPGDVCVFIGHQMSTLPLGLPLEIRSDAHGLWTKTYIFDTSAGNDLLQTARELQKFGRQLGMSIGYKTRAKTYQRKGAQMVRLLQDVDLREYSFLAQQIAMNPEAGTTAVKAGEGEGTAMPEGLAADLTALGEQLIALGVEAKGDLDAAQRLGLETKVGKVMSAKNLASLHEAMKAMGGVHAGVCDQGDACPTRATEGKANPEPTETTSSDEPPPTGTTVAGPSSEVIRQQFAWATA